MTDQSSEPDSAAAAFAVPRTALALPAPLREYQWEGVAFLARSESALLADEMGLGKTVQTAVALRLAMAEPDSGRCLIVCPASLVLNWMSELEKWAPQLVTRQLRGTSRNRAAMFSLPIQVLIASYEQVRQDGLTFASDVPFDLLILDEAQRIKNADSTTALACRLLQRRRAWALTGTPVENSAADMVSVFQFVRPGLIRTGMGRATIHERIRPYFLRRRKGEVLGELPPIIIQDVPLELRPKQQSAYDDIWFSRDLILSESGGDSTANLLALLTRLKQACNFDRESGESSKLDYLQDMLNEAFAAQEKVIVFSQYVETLEWVAPQIAIDNRIFSGAISKEARAQVVDWFENEPGSKTLLLSLRAGGVGLNLNAADQVVLLDRWWNPALEQQAIQRAHRFGRKKPLHVHRLHVPDSVEERVAQVLAQKEQTFDEYVNNAESADAKTLKDELLHILGLNEQRRYSQTRRNDE